jgi:diguanylate cyclase (GGDEF)-like protein
MQRTQPGIAPPPSGERLARVARDPAGLSKAEYLQSAARVFLGPRGVGVALLREGDRLEPGPDGESRRIFRRMSLDDRLSSAIPDARRNKTELALLMIGVDRLDTINDAFGRLAGDRVLATVASRALDILRVGDLLARYGGDEFAMLALGPDSVDARLLAERVRRSVQTLRLSAGGRAVRVTVSVGVATLAEMWADDRPARLLLARAYSRMCSAKAIGPHGLSDADAPSWQEPIRDEGTAA